VISEDMDVVRARALLSDFAEDAWTHVAWLIDEVGMDHDAYERRPLALLEPLQDYIAEFPDDDAGEDPWVPLQIALAAHLADVLIRSHGARWVVEDVPGRPAQSSFVLRVTGLDGRTRTLDPAELVREHFDPGDPDVYAPVVHGLDRARVTPWHAGTAPAGRPPTPVQRWLLGLCAHFAAINGYPVDRLGGSPDDRLRALRMLFEVWGAYDADLLDEQVRFLLGHGMRAEFEESAAVAAALAGDERDEYVRLLRVARRIGVGEDVGDDVGPLARLVELRYGTASVDLLPHLVPLLTGERPPGPGAAELNWFLTQALGRPDFADAEADRLDLHADLAFQANRGRYLIWDAGRAFMVLRWGHMVGWLDAEDCWTRILPAARAVQQRYVSWRDMAACYLQARYLWAGREPINQGRYEDVVRDLAADPDGPWGVPWDLPLDRDW
jgi:hypothetical protein